MPLCLRLLLPGLSVPEAPSAFSPKDLAAQAVTYTKEHYRKREERLDRILTGPFTGTAVMVLLLLGIFWLTITGANYPSSMLWDLFFSPWSRGWLRPPFP